MITNKNIKKISIERVGNSFKLDWEYQNPGPDGETGGATTCIDEYELFAHLINPHELNFTRIQKEALIMNTPTLMEWDFIEDFCNREKISRAQVYLLLAKGELEKMKLGKFTLIKKKENNEKK